MNNDKLMNILCEFDSVTLLEFSDFLKENLVNICCAKGSNAKIINQNINEPKTCPCCKSRMNKNGHTKPGVQKYMCSNLECKFTLSETTGTVTYCSKKPFEVWKNVIDNLVDGLSLQRIADKNKISKTTSFNMRHKILNALELFLETTRISGKAQADEKIFKINLKGTKKEKMPRMSKKRTSSGTAGISKHDICALSVLDDNDNLIFKIGGLSRVSNKMLDDTLTGRITADTELTTDSASAYQKFCRDNNLIHIAIPSGNHADKNGNNLAEINGVHSQLEIWLTKFHGVSTRHLQSYLDWFSYVFMMKKRFENNKLELEMYKNIITANNFINTTKISSKEMPIDLYEAYGDYKYGIFAEQ